MRSWPAVREQLVLLPGYLSAHLQLTLLALLLGVLVSIPLGVAISRVPRLERLVLGAASVVQTIPSLALLAFLVPVLAALGLSSIGFLPALIGLFLYSLLPVLRNTVTGLAAVDPAFVEAARGVGMTSAQQLWRVELPLAAPVIIAGVRTAAVWTVGTATLATPVGAASLGSYIFSGLQTRNYTAILIGCIASAALALILDGLVRLLELGWQRQKPLLWGAGLGGFVVLLALAAGPGARALLTPSRPTPVLTIGAKTFTEQYILSRILAGQVTKVTGQPVQTLESLGSTVVFDALRNGQIDAYVDYTGTLWALVLKRTDLPKGPKEALLEVTRALRAEYGIEVAAQLGFENAYALAMRRADAARLGVRTLSDLTRHAPTLRIGSDYEFFQRSEWQLLKRTYGLAFAEQRSMDPSLMYEALRIGQVDVISAFSSDGRIASYGLTLLADDRHAALPYDAVVLTRRGLAAQHPRVMAALQQLGGTISAERMRELNAAVDKGGESPQRVAERFLIQNAAGPTSSGLLHPSGPPE